MSNLIQNLTKVRRQIQRNGPRDVVQRIARKSARAIDGIFSTSDLDFPLLAHDVADSRLMLDRATPAHRPGAPLKIAWLCTPPSPGSGGHTTLFRMVKAMEARGHQCTLLLYDRHGTDPAADAAVIRKFWPELSAAITPMPPSISGYDICVASSWETAHVLASRASGPQHLCYFVQDFEPYFYPRGSMYALAEDTYRFGFHHISIGAMVAQLISTETGASATVAPFGCDTDIYGLTNLGPRSGVAFFARPNTDRRGFLLAKMALTLFHAKNPHQPITTYGDAIDDWDVPHTHLGKLTPNQLNELYNSSLAAVAMSFTNVSLVAEEILAAGAVPIVNDSDYVRLDLSSPHVGWAEATPSGIASALERACRLPVTADVLALRSQSVADGWAPTAQVFADTIESIARAGQNAKESSHG